MVRVKTVISLIILALWCAVASAQIQTDKVMNMGRNALYYEDYVLAIQRFNTVISAKPYLHEPYFYRALAKFYLEDYQGAETDVNIAIDKSPFNAQYYNLRAICRVNTDRFADAADDYRMSLRQNVTDKGAWHNLVYCMIETKELDAADRAIDSILYYWPKEVTPLTMKAQVAVMKKDTVEAESWVDRAIALDQYDATAWSMKGMMLLSHGSYREAEEALDHAIMQRQRQAPLYVQRAMSRYHQNNLRGAMGDYDRALEIEPRNYVAHYNRALLRAQVGEDNLAIEDFDFVLTVDPSNMIALYNRALLLDQTGDYHRAIRDISAVIKQYPQFWAGYRYRASILRKIGDKYGAERDEFRILKAEMQARTGTYKQQKTRKKEDLDIEQYNKLITDEEEDGRVLYASELRGRIQNRKAELREMPCYILSYHREQTESNRYIAYSSLVEAANKTNQLEQKIYLTTHEASLDSAQVAGYQQRIVQRTQRANPLQSAVDFYILRDFDAAIDAAGEALRQKAGNVPLLYFFRAQARIAKIEVQKNSLTTDQVRLEYEKAQLDLKWCRQQSPEFSFAYYNRGNVLLRMERYAEAVEEFTQAISLNPQMPEAYFNRAVAYIHMSETEKALSDFSQAGEMGLFQAYSLIKRYSKK